MVVKFIALDILTRDNILYFRQEASVAISLIHPNVVQHFGVTMNPPRLGLVLEYCRYGDLFSVLQELRKGLDADPARRPQVSADVAWAFGHLSHLGSYRCPLLRPLVVS